MYPPSNKYQNLFINILISNKIVLHGLYCTYPLEKITPSHISRAPSIDNNSLYQNDIDVVQGAIINTMPANTAMAVPVICIIVLILLENIAPLSKHIDNQWNSTTSRNTQGYL